MELAKFKGKNTIICFGTNCQIKNNIITAGHIMLRLKNTSIKKQINTDLEECYSFR